MSDGKGSGFTRRSFALGIGGAVVALGLGGGLKLASAQPVLRPVGGQDEDAFISACLRCEKCREACPQGCIVPTTVEKGFLNVRTPTFNFKLGWCDYCQSSNGGQPQCVATCPTTALTLPAGATPENTIIGKAYIVHDWCIAWQNKGNCQLCYDQCPYKAISLDASQRPLVNADVCNGCGKCENVCISMSAGSITAGATDRAITVKPTSEVQRLLQANGTGAA